jgi:uncharacterized protein (DUF111 family)
MQLNLIIDGNFLLHKLVFPLINTKTLYGDLMNALNVNFSKFVDMYPYHQIWFVSDSKKSWRKNVYPEYKENRVRDDSIDWEFIFNTYTEFKNSLDIHKYTVVEELGIEKIWASPVPVGRGLLQGAHGPLPLPAPAAAEILKGLELYGINEEVETVTPTGAVLLRCLAVGQGPFPRMRLEAVGLGAGHREFVTRPNVLRLFVGAPTVEEDLLCEEVVELEANLDDQTPETLAEAATRLLAAGALDVGFSPFYMKKGRPAYKLQVLACPGDETRLARMIFSETGSLGVRLREIRRLVIPREIQKIQTPWGAVRVKVSWLEGKKFFKPEFEDVKTLAQKEGKPLREMYQELYSFLLEVCWKEDRQNL